MRPALALLFLTLAAAPASAAEPAASSRVRIETTAGSFVIEVDGARAPLTAANFLQYVQDGHYDGTIFHRVIANFVIQAGGYTADGKEKPTSAPVPNESGNGLRNLRGTVAMTRYDNPHSGSAQFYVNVADNYSLDPSPNRWGYAVFGRVVEGMDVVDRIDNVATGARAPFAEDCPLEPVVITKAQVVAAAP